MYRLILLFILFLFTSFNPKSMNENKYSLKTEISDEGYLYKSLGNYTLKLVDSSTISLDAYIWKRPNKSGIYEQYKNEYVLTAKSKSIHNNQLTSTWLYGSRVYMDNDELTLNQYPDGVTLYISTTPTAIYNWYTNNDDIGNFYFKWTSSAYEPRLRNND